MPPRSPLIRQRHARADPAIVDAVRDLNPEKFPRVAIDPDPEVAVPAGDADHAEWETYFAHLEAAAASRTSLSGAVKHLAWAAPDDGKPVGIAFVSDIHAGANIDYLRFRQVIETIAATDGLYAVCLGDIFENAKTMSKAGTALYTGVFNNPHDQFMYVLIRFLIAKEKWIVLAKGNHDTRDFNAAGLDRYPELCEKLGVPYMDESGGTLVLDVGRNRYVGAIKHTWSGSSQLNKTNLHRRMWQEWHEWQNADFVATGHLHDPISHSEIRRGRDVAWLQAGTFKTHDEWAEMKGYQPAFGVPVLFLYPDERKVIPLPGPRFDDAVRLLKLERSAA